MEAPGLKPRFQHDQEQLPEPLPAHGWLASLIFGPVSPLTFVASYEAESASYEAVTPRGT